MAANHPALLSRFGADARGISMVETAIVIPALAMLIAGISDVAMGYAARLRIQQAADRSADLATAGGLNSAAFATLQSEAATASGVSTDQVSVETWLECAGVRQASFEGTCFAGQQVARFVSVTINGSYNPKFPLMRYLSGNALPLQGYSVVRMQ